MNSCRIQKKTKVCNSIKQGCTKPLHLYFNWSKFPCPLHEVKAYLLLDLDFIFFEIEIASKPFCIQDRNTLVSLDPVDAVKSSLQDLAADTTKRGAFDFKVILKDKFQNHIHLTKDHTTVGALSVQYTPFEKATSFQFIKCYISTTPEKAGSIYSVSCAGADYERILVYPSINNVPVGGRESYEVTTTLCPGKFSCHGT